MLGISLFSNKVWSGLVKLGRDQTDMPPITPFKYLCDALKANGYNADMAAALWDRVLKGEEGAVVELRNNTGALGKLYVGEDGYWN
jgi:hypothetical protein